MTFATDLEAETKSIFTAKWTERDGLVVPEAKDVGLGADAVKLDGTVLYADLAESTQLVDGYLPWFAADVYKAYLHSAARIIKHNGGEITAYDGDRIMAVFNSPTKNTSAARAALGLNYFVVKILNPQVRQQYPTIDPSFSIRHAAGIDTSPLFVARTGIRGSNDLVWVGKAANYAAKLCSLREGDYATWITDRVFARLSNELKTSSDGRAMWEQRTWTKTAMTVYRSNWYWVP